MPLHNLLQSYKTPLMVVQLQATVFLIYMQQLFVKQARTKDAANGQGAASSTLNLYQDLCEQLVVTSTVIIAAMIYMRATICKRARTECGQEGQHQQEGN